MTATKPYADACERNRDPILEVLRRHFADRRRVLEIGSGTGQHAVHFAAALPQLSWQSSDLASRLPGIRQWLEESGLPNLPPPIALDIDGEWPSARFDAVFTANTLYIVSWSSVRALFAALPAVLTGRGLRLACQQSHARMAASYEPACISSSNAASTVSPGARTML